nr:MAG TPA: MU-AGATOXIN-I, EXCITATORY INSECT TOXIN [Caudoviricetes sp.]
MYMSYRQIICVCTKRRPTHLKSELYCSCKFYGKCLYASPKHTSFIPLCFA